MQNLPNGQTQPPSSSREGSESPSNVDLALALGATALGAAAMFQGRNADLVLDPGALGSITLGMTGTLFLWINGERYRTIIMTMLPIFVVQIVAALRVHTNPAWILQYPLLFLGIVGFAKRYFAESAASTRARTRATGGEPWASKASWKRPSAKAAG